MANDKEKIKADCFSFADELNSIIKDWKDGSDEPLDGDEVDILTEILRAKLNLIEGNITDKEYDEMEF